MKKFDKTELVKRLELGILFEEEREMEAESSNELSIAQGKQLGLSQAIDIVDEFHKMSQPEVPDFVVDWFLENENNLEQAIFNINCDIDDMKYNKHITEIEDWFSYSSHKPIETVFRMKDYGYRVSGDKLYYMRLKNGMADQLQLGKKTYLNVVKGQKREGTYFFGLKEFNYPVETNTKFTKTEVEKWKRELNNIDFHVEEVN